MISAIIEARLKPAENYIYGFADLRGFLNKKFDGFHYGISIGRKLDYRITDQLIQGPTIEYFEHYKQVNSELAGLTASIESDLKASGMDALKIPPTISFAKKCNKKYLKALSYDISHKMVATRAGLGWIGKTDLFISDVFGPRLRLVTILLKQEPERIGVPIEESRCGKCVICVKKCPAGAANGIPWKAGVHRDMFFDAFRCRQKCAELARERLNVDERICGLCVSVCPFGKNKKSGLFGTDRIR